MNPLIFTGAYNWCINNVPDDVYWQGVFVVDTIYIGDPDTYLMFILTFPTNE